MGLLGQIFGEKTAEPETESFDEFMTSFFEQREKPFTLEDFRQLRKDYPDINSSFPRYSAGGKNPDKYGDYQELMTKAEIEAVFKKEWDIGGSPFIKQYPFGGLTNEWKYNRGGPAHEISGERAFYTEGKGGASDTLHIQVGEPTDFAAELSHAQMKVDHPEYANEHAMFSYKNMTDKLTGRAYQRTVYGEDVYGRWRKGDETKEGGWQYPSASIFDMAKHYLGGDIVWKDYVEGVTEMEDTPEEFWTHRVYQPAVEKSLGLYGENEHTH